jgi:hypothetical protein
VTVNALGELRGEERDLAMVLSEQDVADLAVTIEVQSDIAALMSAKMGLPPTHVKSIWSRPCHYGWA